jgi:hypothetical protein
MAALFVLSIRCLAAVAACRGHALASAAELTLGEGSVIRFADVRQGVEALTTRDDYIRQLSPFDRQVRLQANRDVSEQEFLAFISRHVLPWQDQDIRKLTPLIEALSKKLVPWKLKLPSVVLLVKTSGREEAGAAYCRGAAVALPQNMVDGRMETLAKVLPHEVFHILSRHNPPLREALYQAIGFKACNEVPLPAPLADRKITNPDAPVNDHFITADLNGRAAELMPVLFSKTERYEVQRGGTLFSYLDFKLMLLEAEGGVRRAAILDGKPVLLEPAAVPGFAEQVGRNTKYIIHPEEILADNFVFLLDGRINLPTPRVVESMGNVLQSFAAQK